MRDRSNPAVAIIGAGPYGVSIAAHMLAAGMDLRIFGKPMHRWRYQMPVGMYLKSEGRASSLSDPTGRHTLERFCADEGLPFTERTMPVSLETFTRYALAFQRELVPSVEEIMVDSIEESPGGFDVQLADGSGCRTRRAVVATGLEHSTYVPPVFLNLPPELISHSSDHRSLTRFRGKDVTVIGGGQSALETAALLLEEGAQVRIIVRRPAIEWNSPPRLGNRSFYRRMRHPLSNLGEGIQLALYSSAPFVFRCFPRRLRVAKVKTVLHAAGAWWLRGRVEGRMETLRSHFVSEAEATGGRVALRLSGAGGTTVRLTTDHVIAATGYRFDVQRLAFLSDGLKKRLRTEEQRPKLSSGFESTVPGLYFAGMASANAFGPVMRFLAGADFTARSITGHIAADGQHHSSPSRRSAATVGAK
jgi:thioredoxin reductase